MPFSRQEKKHLTHTHTTRHTLTLQQGLTLYALPPTPWKSQPLHPEKVVCVLVPHKTLLVLGRLPAGSERRGSAR